MPSEFESSLDEIKNCPIAKESEREQLIKKNPKLSKLFQAYDNFINDPKNRKLLEARKKSLASAKKKATPKKKNKA